MLSIDPRAAISQPTCTVLCSSRSYCLHIFLVEGLSSLKHNEDDHYQITSLKPMAQEMIVADRSACLDSLICIVLIHVCHGICQMLTRMASHCFPHLIYRSQNSYP